MSWTRFRVQYFVQYALLGAVLPFLPLYLEGRGYGEGEIAAILSLWGLMVMIAPATLTFLADRYFSNRAIIMTCFAASAAALAGLLLAGERLGLMMLAYGGFCLAYTGLIPVVDGLTFDRLRRHRDRHAPSPPDAAREAPADLDEGHTAAPPHGEGGGRAAPSFQSIRIWGSVGFLAPATIVLALSLSGLIGPAWTGGVGGVAMLIAALAAAGGIATAFRLPRVRTGEGAKLPTLDAVAQLRQPPVAALFLGILLLSASVAPFYAYYPVYLRRIGVDDAWIAMVINLGVAIEIGFMFAFPWLLRRLGLRGVLTFGAAAMLLRMTLLAAQPSIPVAILTQACHGPFVITTYLAATMYLNHRAGDAYRNSMQGLYAMCNFGLVRAIATPIAGVIAEATHVESDPAWSIRMAFTFSAGCALASTLVFLLLFRDPKIDAVMRAAEAPHASSGRGAGGSAAGPRREAQPA